MLGLLSVLKKYKNTRFSSEMIRKQRKLRGDLVQKSPTPTNGVEPSTLKLVATVRVQSHFVNNLSTRFFVLTIL